jgi:ankyrin repeat protein
MEYLVIYPGAAPRKCPSLKSARKWIAGNCERDTHWDIYQLPEVMTHWSVGFEGHSKPGRLVDTNTRIHYKHRERRASQAAYNGHVSFLRLYLKRGVKFDLEDALRGGVMAGSLPVVKLMVKHGVNPKKGNLVAIAAAAGHQQVVKYLMDRGAPVVCPIFSPYHKAIEHNHLNILRYLLKRRPLTPRELKDMDLLKRAARYGRPEAVSFLLGRNMTQGITRAIEAANPKTLKQLLDQGTVPAKKLKDALKLAVQCNSLKSVRMLLDYGVSVDSNQGLPLLVAAEYGYVGIAKFLLDRGADIEARGPVRTGVCAVINGARVTPLQVAVKKGHVKVAKLLLERGAETEIQVNPLIQQAFRTPQASEMVDLLTKHAGR